MQFFSGDRFYGTAKEYEEEELKDEGEKMITKSKIEKQTNVLITPVQYWLAEDFEIRCCNVKGMTKNGASTYSTPQILFIKHTTKNRSIDISIPLKKAHKMIDIINDFINVNSDFFEDH